MIKVLLPLLLCFTSLGYANTANINTANTNSRLAPPNILWLTFEDTSAFELSTYGNKNIVMPHIDTLAVNGIRFNNVSSNAPYCSPARSTLISGAYATTYGADHHRAPVSASPNRLYFPSFLRQAGYFTTNNKKRDYNVKLSKNELNNIWDEYDGRASYNSKNRHKDQPFFAVFNANITHMSRLTSHSIEGRRDFTKSGINSAAKPDYLPTLEEIKSDYQFHLEGVTDIDTWVGLFVNDLKARGLFENTIIFVFSDHGGSSPRGKGFLYHSTGLNPPFILHVPKAYKHLVPSRSEALANKQLGFVDFGPTVLSLAGIESPKEMQGQAFLGKHALHTRKLNYAYRTNQEQHYDPQRGVTDGHYTYIKNYLPRKPLQLRNDFQWGMPSNIALDEYAKSSDGKALAKSMYRAKQGEYLFHITQDKYEQHDLSTSTQQVHQNKLLEMRNYVSEHIRNSGDLGFLPLSFKENKDFASWLPANFDIQQLYKLAETVSSASEQDLAIFEKLLQNEHAVIRFWAAQGMAELAARGILVKASPVLISASNDSNAAVATVAKEALVYLRHTGAVDLLLSASDKAQRRSALETIAWTKPFLLMPYLDYFKQHKSIENRVILAALGKLPTHEIVKQKTQDEAQKINLIRRAITPLPN